MKAGGQGPVQMAIPRIYSERGAVDTNGINSAKHAIKAGVREVGGYIFPCVPCGKPKDDVQKAVDAYEAMLKTTDYKGKTMIWLDIERS